MQSSLESSWVHATALALEPRAIDHVAEASASISGAMDVRMCFREVASPPASGHPRRIDSK